MNLINGLELAKHKHVKYRIFNSAKCLLKGQIKYKGMLNIVWAVLFSSAESVVYACTGDRVSDDERTGLFNFVHLQCAY